MIRAIFFDIDGTLVSLQTKVYSDSARIALEKLREKGVKLFIATGRSRFEIEEEGLLDGLHFDGYLTNNGQISYTASGEILHSNPIDPQDAAAVLALAARENIACWVVGADESLLSRDTPEVRAAMESIHTRLPRLGDLQHMLEKPIYKIVLFLPAQQMREAMQVAPHSKTTQWFELGHDIICKDGGKMTAMRAVLRHYGIDRSESMSFGDSENDLEMLRYAQIGVAMGNSTKEAKEAADYVTDDVDEDGLYNALVHFGIL
ncbi:MAG: Cof-type HAD-IIB family hydrolase [Oscillospiraceae bacterium]|jgi:Cof subfamily protein (haloacid dehalogenase superfamily)|nr:Cof-type HAD-IIB family hydrolase [Oscillospiraceae bacterium]